MAKVSFVTLGCPKNRVDSDSLMEKLVEAGIAQVDDPGDADIILVNTCGFIEDAKRESVEEILKLKELRQQGKKLIVFGCLAQRYREELISEIPEIDMLWGVGQDREIVEYCKSVEARQSAISGQIRKKGEQLTSPAERTARVRQGTTDRRLPAESYAYLKIADGCSRGCSFCIIPAIRGPYRSSGAGEVLNTAEKHIASGARELILVAQDIGSYGREAGDYGLPSLIRDIASLKGDFRIRLLYVYPTSVSDELLEVVAEEKKVCRYLDIPLQHSEDRILQAMGRPGTRQWYRKLFAKIRHRIPDATLRTTLIVGFPGETEEEFLGLKSFVEELEFDRLGVFTYSREEGTAAFALKGAVPKKVRVRRRNEIMAAQAAISLGKNLKLVGRQFRALVDEVDERVAVARLCSQAPEIDGVVFIETSTKRLGSGKNVQRSPRQQMPRVGDFIEVKIIEAFDYDLRGEPV